MFKPVNSLGFEDVLFDNRLTSSICALTIACTLPACGSKTLQNSQVLAFRRPIRCYPAVVHAHDCDPLIRSITPQQTTDEYSRASALETPADHGCNASHLHNRTFGQPTAAKVAVQEGALEPRHQPVAALVSPSLDLKGPVVGCHSTRPSSLQYPPQAAS